jgi:hypothetical protein
MTMRSAAAYAFNRTSVCGWVNLKAFCSRFVRAERRRSRSPLMARTESTGSHEEVATARAGVQGSGIPCLGDEGRQCERLALLRLAGCSPDLDQRTGHERRQSH